MIYLAITINALWSLYSPASQALMSARVSPEHQGRLQGALGGIHAVTAIFSPAVFPLTFAWAIGPGSPWQEPGAPFWLAAEVLLVALGACWRVTRAG